MSQTLTGSCCCEKVKFTVEDNFKRFFFCHCTQCQKMSGSAHAANLFTDLDNIHWLSGQDDIKYYRHHERAFSQAFCTECGSTVPYTSSNGKLLVVPAGSLNEEPSITLNAQIFCDEQTEWHKNGLEAEKVSGFPK